MSGGILPTYSNTCSLASKSMIWIQEKSSESPLDTSTPITYLCPLTGSLNSLYDEYGDVDYPFEINPYDIALIYLSDGTYIETRILQVYKQSGLIRLKLDISLSNTLKAELANQTYKRFLILSRKIDETNVILSFTKREGKTSYGFLIPENLSTEVLANIDTITREVKQKLINDQNVISDINGGTFGP
jgi:cold shock CspA family protein